MRSTLVLAFACAAVSCVAAQATPDPRYAVFVKACDQRIAVHPFFKRITLLEKWTQDPFVFYLERPPRDESGYLRKVVHSYLPFLTKLAAVFEKEYATPLKLSRDDNAAGFAIAVLASRGSYGNFAQAVRVSALHQSRAHYDPRIRLAVTYVDAFSQYGTGLDERQAVLHEFVHALQHAYSSGGNMPSQAWFNEGLAEYRSVCTNLANSLESPILDQGHLMTLAAVLGSPKHGPLLLPLSDLIAADSYEDVLKRAKKRLGAAPDPRLALQVFYAQSAALVAFLHQGEGGKHRPTFQAYADAVMRGRGGAGATLPSLEPAFRRYVAAEARRRLGYELDGAEIGTTPAVLPPPAKYDPTKLRWRQEELGVRLSAARAQCVRGKYEAAAELLLGVEGDSPEESKIKREAQRITAILRLRDDLFKVALEKKTRFAPKVDGTRIRGQFMGRDGDSFILKNKRSENRVPLTVLTPDNLAFECKKVGLISRTSWETAWLSWLGGQSAKRALRDLEATGPARALGADIQGTFEAHASDAAVALSDIQDLKPAKEPRDAARQLAELTKAIRTNRKSELFIRREGPLRACVRALAQRAFSLDDPQCLGISGKASRGSDGTIQVEYDGSSTALAKDFRLDKKWTESILSGYGQLATKGSYIRGASRYGELGGSGVFLWPLRLFGPQVIELQAELTGPGYYEVILCANEHGWVRTGVGGSVSIYDTRARISDALGEPRDLYEKKVYKLRIENDGKSRLKVSVNGKKTAELTRIGFRIRGALGLVVHSSNPLRIHSLTLHGKVSTTNALELRQSFVDRVLRELWP